MMRILLGCIALLFGLPAAAQPITLASLPVVYQQSIPTELPRGLQMVELHPRCEQCIPWREINFYGLTEPVRTERVSVSEGYRAMYAFPDTHYFANVKIERSDTGQFEIDRDLVERGLRHECQRKLTNVENYLAENPKAREKLELIRMPGHPYVEVEEGARGGISFIACTENAVGLISSTISQVQMFIPSRHLTITAYLLKQEKMNFRTIEKFRELRDEFINGYCDFLNKQ